MNHTTFFFLFLNSMLTCYFPMYMGLYMKSELKSDRNRKLKNHQEHLPYHWYRGTTIALL